MKTKVLDRFETVAEAVLVRAMESRLLVGSEPKFVIISEDYLIRLKFEARKSFGYKEDTGMFEWDNVDLSECCGYVVVKTFDTGKIEMGY